MRIIHTLFLILLSLIAGFLTASDYTTPSITPIQKFSEVANEQLDENSLILLDIDNTIFRSTTHYGSAEFFAWMVDDEMQRTNCTKSQAQLRVYKRWIKSQNVITTKLIDEKIHDFIKVARSKHAKIIAFTARQPQISEITHRQVLAHQIDLDQLPGFVFTNSYQNQIYPDHNWCTLEINKNICTNTTNKEYHNSEALFYKGILFAHDLNKKGKIFTDFYNQYLNYTTHAALPTPQKIIFIDDGLHNLQSMAESVEKLGLKFYGYHIASTDFKFDSEQAKREEASYNVGSGLGIK